MTGDVIETLADDAATAAFGRRVAAVLRPGDLVLLRGDLGTGKTALARAIVRALLDDGQLDVPSPSFALVQPYARGALRLIHADLYRLASEAETEELGLLDDSGAIVLVEWPERAPGLAARATAEIRLAIPPDGTGRIAALRFADGRAA